MSTYGDRWLKRIFWLIFIMGGLILGVNLVYGSQEVALRRKLQLEQDWMEARIRWEASTESRLKSVEHNNESDHKPRSK